MAKYFESLPVIQKKRYVKADKRNVGRYPAGRSGRLRPEPTKSRCLSPAGSGH